MLARKLTASVFIIIALVAIIVAAYGIVDKRTDVPSATTHTNRLLEVAESASLPHWTELGRFQTAVQQVAQGGRECFAVVWLLIRHPILATV